MNARHLFLPFSLLFLRFSFGRMVHVCLPRYRSSGEMRRNIQASGLFIGPRRHSMPRCLTATIDCRVPQAARLRIFRYGALATLGSSGSKRQGFGPARFQLAPLPLLSRLLQITSYDLSWSHVQHVGACHVSPVDPRRDHARLLLLPPSCLLAAYPCSVAFSLASVSLSLGLPVVEEDRRMRWFRFLA